MKISKARLSQFLEEEMKRRDMSLRQFAEKMGISQPTLSRMVDMSKDDDSYLPDLRTLLAISEGTHTDIGWLLAYITESDISHVASVNHIATRIAALPNDRRQMIEELVGMYIKLNEGGDNK